MENEIIAAHLNEQQLQEIISTARTDIASHAAAIAVHTILQAAAESRLIALQLQEAEQE